MSRVINAIIERIEANRDEQVASIRTQTLERLIEIQKNLNLSLSLIEAGKRESTTKFEMVVAEIEANHAEETSRIERAFTEDIERIEAEFEERIRRFEMASFTTAEALLECEQVDWIREGF